MRDVLFGDDDGSQADTHIMFTYGRYWKDQGIDPPEGHENDYTMGKGWLGCVCWDDMACNSIIEKHWRTNWREELVFVFVHEIGHNLGAIHDEETINCKARCECQGVLHHNGTGTVTCDSCKPTNTIKYIMAEKLSGSLLEFRAESSTSQLWTECKS